MRAALPTCRVTRTSAIRGSTDTAIVVSGTELLGSFRLRTRTAIYDEYADRKQVLTGLGFTQWPGLAHAPRSPPLRSGIREFAALPCTPVLHPGRCSRPLLGACTTSPATRAARPPYAHLFSLGCTMLAFTQHPDTHAATRCVLSFVCADLQCVALL